VQGIDAASGNRGDTKKRNSSTKVGKKTHVDSWAVVYGGLSPLILSVLSKSAIVDELSYEL
jgi:hypothetical protein